MTRKAAALAFHRLRPLEAMVGEETQAAANRDRLRDDLKGKIAISFRQMALIPPLGYWVVAGFLRVKIV
jgi:hypothetical protein